MGFVKVKCGKCQNEQVINAKPSMSVECLVCQEQLAQSQGGAGIITGKILEHL